MKRLIWIGLGLFAFTFFCFSFTQAEELGAVSDKFYDGLAQVIEQNMKDAQACLKATETYFQEHQQDIEKMRKAIQESMQKLTKNMNQKQTMPLSKPGQAKAKEEQTTSGAAEKTQSSAGSARYSKAMGEFSKKYPQEAKEITSKVMQSLMGFGSANKK